MHLDEYGLIVQADGDGGDTAQRMGMYGFALALTGEVPSNNFSFSRALRSLEIEPGVCVRHPFQTDFRSDPKHFSRDQQDPLIIAAGAWENRSFVKRMFVSQIKRLFTYQNKDIGGPATAGIYIRALNAWYLWPLLLLCDLQLLFNAFAIWYRSRNNPDYVDDNNHIMRLAQAQYDLPTPVSFAARKLYRRIRPINFGCVMIHPGEYHHPVYGALWWYHRADNGGNPEIAELYRPIIELF